MAARFVFQKLSGMSRSTSINKINHLVTSSQGSGVKTLCNLFHQAAVRPGNVVPKNRGIHGYAARSSCSRPAAAKTSWPTTRMPSIIKKRTTLTFVDSVTGCICIKQAQAF